jgi:hypothetical protein
VHVFDERGLIGRRSPAYAFSEPLCFVNRRGRAGLPNQNAVAVAKLMDAGGVTNHRRAALDCGKRA